MDWFGPDAPKMRPEEKWAAEANMRLAGEAEGIIQRQIEENKTILPFIAQQEGFNVTVDPETGQITGISQIETPEMARDKQIRGLFQERSLAALKGDLPVDPAMERSLQEQEQELRNRLKQQLGPDYETSSAGMEALQRHRQSAEELRYGARTNTLTLAEQLGLTREQQEMYRRGTAQDVFRQFGIADPMSFAGALGQAQQGYAMAASPYEKQRHLEYQAEAAQAANLWNTVGSVAGAVGSVAMGKPPIPGIGGTTNVPKQQGRPY